MLIGIVVPVNQVLNVIILRDALTFFFTIDPVGQIYNVAHTLSLGSGFVILWRWGKGQARKGEKVVEFSFLLSPWIILAAFWAFTYLLFYRIPMS
ncbi:MAG: hypothetical protein M1503_08170 [Thaumarchaeota archaeon]|nr:hypothetical protein [Nitrososphaerota archaeon]